MPLLSYVARLNCCVCVVVALCDRLILLLCCYWCWLVMLLVESGVRLLGLVCFGCSGGRVLLC